MAAEYDKALQDIAQALETLRTSSHQDAQDVVDAVGSIPQVEQVDNSEVLDSIAQLLGYADMLLVVLVVAMVLLAGLMVGYIVTERLR